MQDAQLPDSITARARKLGRQYELGLLTEEEVGQEFQDAVDRYVSSENRDGRWTRGDLAKRVIRDLDLPPGAVAALWQFVGAPISPEEQTDLDSAADRALLQAVSVGNYWAFENLASVAYVDRAVPDPVWKAVREVALLPQMDAFAALILARDHTSQEKLETAHAAGLDRASTQEPDGNSTVEERPRGDSQVAPPPLVIVNDPQELMTHLNALAAAGIPSAVAIQPSPYGEPWGAVHLLHRAADTPYRSPASAGMWCAVSEDPANALVRVPHTDTTVYHYRAAEGAFGDWCFPLAVLDRRAGAGLIMIAEAGDDLGGYPPRARNAAGL